jgi:SAM-dependent methyltransferase
MDICELAIANYATLRRHPWEEARIQVVADKLKREIRVTGENDITVLDIGCGDAYVAYRLSLRSPRLVFFCVDTAFTPELMKKLKRQINTDKITLYESLKDVRREYTGTVDFVLLLDVIEHIERDVEFLKTLHADPLVSKETKILITAPAFQALFSNHDVWLKHYRRHTLRTLDEAVTRAGFRKLKDGYFFFSLLFPRIVQKLIERKNAEVRGVVGYTGGRLKTMLLKNILVLDYHCFRMLTDIGIRVPGLSCFTICEKKG